MNALPQPVPSDDELNAWIRAHPETWDAPAPGDEARAELLLQSIVSGERLARHRNERRRHRRSVVAIVTGALVVGGAAGAAALARSGQPERPELGVVCRADVSLDADGLVLPASDDPVEACAEAWANGRVADGEVPDAPTPSPSVPAELTACVGPGRAIEVFPGAAEVCDRLGLVPLDPRPDDLTLLADQLVERVAVEVNLAGCTDADVASAGVQRILADLGLSTWVVEVEPAAADAACTVAIVDTARSSIVIRPMPSR